jgi:hypothetical protein
MDSVPFDSFMAAIVDFLRACPPHAAEIAGVREADITEYEARRGYQLPGALRAFVRHLGGGVGPLHDLLDTWSGKGEPAVLIAMEDASRVAADLAAEGGWAPPPRALPLNQHHGYQYKLTYLDEGDDPPVDYYIEGQELPSRVAPTFTSWLREAALLAVELPVWHAAVLAEMRTCGLDAWLPRKEQLHRWEERAVQLRDELQRQVATEDVARGALTGPLAFQVRWVETFSRSDLWQELRAAGQRMPWGWTRIG